MLVAYTKDGITCTHCGRAHATQEVHEDWCPHRYRATLDHGYTKLVDSMGDDLAPLEAARMSTGNPTGVDGQKDAATRDHLWRNAHATPFEMNELEVEFQMPIFVAREVFRHRTFSFNEFSGRYAEMPNLYYVPGAERILSAKQSTTNKQGGEAATWDRVFVDNVQQDFTAEQGAVRQTYEGLLDVGMERGLARINLPLSQYTRFRMKGNLRNWFHFIDLRIRRNALWEIRQYATQMAEIIRELWPDTWATFEEHTLYGASFSRTEIQLLNGVIDAWFGNQMEMAVDSEDTLGKSRHREFMAKLGRDENGNKIEPIIYLP